MSTITVRAIGANNDPQWGQGQGNFLTDLDAVRQIIYTRLLLFAGEWWADLLDGLPLWQSILGQGGNSVSQISSLIEARIQDTPYVTGLENVSASYTASTRAFQFSCQVNTQFGVVQVTYPVPPSGALSNG